MEITQLSRMFGALESLEELSCCTALTIVDSNLMKYHESLVQRFELSLSKSVVISS